MTIDIHVGPGPADADIYLEHVYVDIDIYIVCTLQFFADKRVALALAAQPESLENLKEPGD